MNYLRILFVSLMFLLLNNTALITNAEQIPEPALISTYEDDLTGDGLKEMVKLNGSLFSREGSYYQDIWVELTSKNSEQWRLSFKGGYEPQLHFYDFNQDNINDLLFQSVADENEKIYSHHLYTLKNNTLKEIPLPEQLYTKGHFKNNFQIEIQISTNHNSKPIIIDVADRAKKYISLGLYNKRGKLLKSKVVMIAPISFYEPILISKSKGYGLKSYQKLSGVNREDALGTIETLWYYENGTWIILQTDWSTSNQSK